MLLGTILTNLRNEADAAAALAALDDLALFSQVQTRAAQYDETPGEYAAGAVSRFAAAASDEDWLALMTAIENSNDPARTTLDRMVRWSLAQDAKAEAPAGCGDGGCGCAGH
jgi:hypothetical protein